MEPEQDRPAPASSQAPPPRWPPPGLRWKLLYQLWLNDQLGNVVRAKLAARWRRIRSTLSHG